MGLILILILCLIQPKVLDAACTLPDNLRGSTWEDSDQGSLVFTDTYMTGWTFTYRIGGADVVLAPAWECYHNVSGEFATLIFMSNTTIQYNVNGDVFRPFLCLQMTAITPHSYYYYINAPEQEQLYNQRVNMQFETTVSGITDPQSEVCNFVDAGIMDNEYHVLIKDGNEADAIQTCPSAFFGTYSYNVTDLGTGTSTCGTGDERWDVCADRSRMTLNYTICNTPIAYSANGSLFCVASITSGSYILHTVYNEDATVDDVNTFRFTCYVSSLGSDGSVTTSQSPRSCTKSQTPDTQPTLTNGTVVGFNIALTPIVLCPLTSAMEEEDNNNTGAIIGGVLGGLALIVLLVILVYICLHFKLLSCLCKRNKQNNSKANADDEKKPIDQENTLKKEKERPQWSDPVSMSKTKPRTCFCWKKQRDSGKKDIFTREDVRDVPNNQTGQIPKISNERTTVISDDDEVKERNDAVEKPKTERRFTDIASVENEKTHHQESLTMQNPKKETRGTNTDFQPIHFQSSTDRVETYSSKPSVGDYDKDEIQVSRVAQNEPVQLSKGQHLNSTENICADYDAAMSYSHKLTRREKCDPASLFKRPTSSRTFDFVRDDSGIETEIVSRKISKKAIPTSKLSKRSSSEGNMLEGVKENKKQSFKRSKSFRSVFNLGSIQWNFSYESPYALTHEQKQAAAQKRLQNQKRRQREERRKRAQEDKRQQENAEAFQRWSEKKREESSLKLQSLRTASAKDRLYKYKVWA